MYVFEGPGSAMLMVVLQGQPEPLEGGRSGRNSHQYSNPTYLDDVGHAQLGGAARGAAMGKGPPLLNKTATGPLARIGIPSPREGTASDSRWAGGN